MEKKVIRLSWIDIAKGIAIILVVVGHFIQSYGKDLDFLLRLIYSFHMPVFFVISGLTFNWNSKALIFIKKKVKALLFPYILFVIITFVYNVIAALLKGQLSEELEILNKSIFQTVFVTSDSYFINLWFLPCLFLALVFLYIIFHCIKNDIMRGIVCGIIAIASIRIHRMCVGYFPMCCDISGVALLWIYFGYIIHKFKIYKRLEKLYSILFPALILIFLNYLSSILYPDVTDSYRQLLFSNVIISLITGISGTVLIFSVSITIKRNKWIEYIGRNSNLIYGVHFLLLGVLGKILSKLPIFAEYSILRVCIGTIFTICIICIAKLLWENLFVKTRRS